MAMVFKIISPALLKTQFLVLSCTKNWHHNPHNILQIFLLIWLSINNFDKNIVFLGSGLPKISIFEKWNLDGNPEIENIPGIICQEH